MILLLATSVIGVILYAYNKSWYVSFVLWLFMLAPFMRRINDYHFGYQEISLIALAPVLVASFSLYEMIKKLTLLYMATFFPFLLCACGITYGYLIGVVNSGIAAASYDLLLWLAPISLGFIIASDSENYKSYKDSVVNTLIVGGMIIGGYGVYQYFYLPPWDAYWMRNTSITSIGLPFPREVRVFGTMNSPGSYAAMLLACIMSVMLSRSFLRLPSAVLSIAGIALSLIRTAWVGVVVAILHLVIQARGRMVLPLLVITSLAVPVLVFSPLGEVFLDRLETFERLDDDNSARARQQLYGSLTEQALGNPVGIGIGAVGVATKLTNKSGLVTQGIDSGLLIVPHVLGWPGALAMLISIIWLMLRAPGVTNEDSKVCASICVAFIAMMVSYNSMYGVGGILFWTFIGLRICARGSALSSITFPSVQGRPSLGLSV